MSTLCGYCLPQLSPIQSAGTLSGGATHRLAGTYDVNAKDNNYIYFGHETGEFYRYDVTGQFMVRTWKDGPGVASGSFENAVLFTASELNQTKDVLYFMSALYNPATIVKYTNDSALALSKTIPDSGTNLCLIRHPTNTKYLFSIGLFGTNVVNKLIAYDIKNEEYLIHNITLNHVHSVPGCIVMKVESVNYFYVIGGNSVYIERINLDHVVNELNDQMNETFNISNAIINTEWEVINVTIPIKNVSNSESSVGCTNYSVISSSSIVKYRRYILILGGRCGLTNEYQTGNVLYFNVHTNEIGYLDDIPIKMSGSLAVYVNV